MDIVQIPPCKSGISCIFLCLTVLEIKWLCKDYQLMQVCKFHKVVLLGWKKYLTNMHHNVPEFASLHGSVVCHTLAQGENHALNYIKLGFGVSKCNLLWFTKVKISSSCPKCCTQQHGGRGVIHFEQWKKRISFLFIPGRFGVVCRPWAHHHLGTEKHMALFLSYIISSNMMTALYSKYRFSKLSNQNELQRFSKTCRS